MKIFYSPKCLEYSQPGHPEAPARARSTYEYLEKKGYEFTAPRPCADEDILLAHSPQMRDSVRNGSFFDPDTPVFPGIFDIAKLAAGGAIEAAMHCLTTGEKAFSLMRPPGHHATRSNPGGFCYFNNIAIASLKVKEKAGKIAVVDFDCHHGNGTEDILLGSRDFLYLSLHQSPLYPGTGLRSRENCINYPLPARTTPIEYLSLLKKGLEKVTEFAPDLLAISAGFDTYKLDPIAGLSLEQETYWEIGRMLKALNKPTFAVLEGGYSRDLPECVHQFLIGLEG
ncbi:MAG: histone deacetylase [Nitrospirae bacterium]|nr:histone deacetylase [Nitrospirota bacterium]